MALRRAGFEKIETNHEEDSAANKVAQDSDVYHGSAFAEFSGSCSFLIRFSSQLEGAHFCHCYHDG